MPAVLLIRHAQGSFGSDDYDVLSERGHEQVQALHETFDARGGFHRMVSGSLRRQLDTAEPFKASGLELGVDPRWNEYESEEIVTRFGTLPEEPLSSQQFQGILDEALRAWVAGGEDFTDFKTRALGAFDDFAASLGSGETGLAFTSGGVMGVICARAMGLPDEAFIAFNRIAINAGITKLVVGRSGSTLISFNEHSHLEPRGLVTYR
jgi:broad specificity phosphatase PhoE